MITIATAQELRVNLGDRIVSDRTCTEWIDWAIEAIERYFVKDELGVVMETVGLNARSLIISMGVYSILGMPSNALGSSCTKVSYGTISD